MKALKEISTHIAYQVGNEIKIYLKGMDKDALDPQGEPLFTEVDYVNYPHWFKEELIMTLPSYASDDLFAIFEGYEEQNRINLAEANSELAPVMGSFDEYGDTF